MLTLDTQFHSVGLLFSAKVHKDLFIVYRYFFDWFFGLQYLLSLLFFYFILRIRAGLRRNWAVCCYLEKGLFAFGIQNWPRVPWLHACNTTSTAIQPWRTTLYWMWYNLGPYTDILSHSDDHDFCKIFALLYHQQQYYIYSEWPMWPIMLFSLPPSLFLSSFLSPFRFPFLFLPFPCSCLPRLRSRTPVNPAREQEDTVEYFIKYNIWWHQLWSFLWE